MTSAQARPFGPGLARAIGASAGAAVAPRAKARIEMIEKKSMMIDEKLFEDNGGHRMSARRMRWSFVVLLMMDRHGLIYSAFSHALT